MIKGIFKPTIGKIVATILVIAFFYFLVYVLPIEILIFLMPGYIGSLADWSLSPQLFIRWVIGVLLIYGIVCLIFEVIKEIRK